MENETIRYNLLVIRNKVDGAVFYATRKETETVKVYTARLKTAAKSRSQNLLCRALRLHGLDNFTVKIEGNYESKTAALIRKVELVEKRKRNFLMMNMPAFSETKMVLIPDTTPVAEQPAA